MRAAQVSARALLMIEHKTQLHRWPNYDHWWHCTSFVLAWWVNGISQCGWKILPFFLNMKNKRNICQRTITRYELLLQIHAYTRMTMSSLWFDFYDRQRRRWQYAHKFTGIAHGIRRIDEPNEEHVDQFVCASRDIANHHDDCFRRQQFFFLICFVFLAVVVVIPLRWMKKQRKKTYKMNIKQ